MPYTVRYLHLLVISFVCVWQFATTQLLNLSIAQNVAETISCIMLVNSFSFLVVDVVWKRKDVKIARNTARFILAICVVTAASAGIQYVVAITLFESDVAYLAQFVRIMPWRFTMWAMMYALIALFFINEYMIEKYEKKLTTEAVLRDQLKEAELEFLRSQINPHFLFNSLNLLSSLIVLDPDKANEMVIKMSDYLRYSLSNKEEFRRFDDELTNVDRFLEISKTRFGSKLQYSSEVSKDALNTKIPFMILQPIIENAVKYGVSKNIDTTEVKIKAHLVDKMLKIEVCNNYSDEPKNEEESLGIGLKNIRERLKIYFENEKLMSMESKDGMFVVRLSIPQTEEK